MTLYKYTAYLAISICCIVYKHNVHSDNKLNMNSQKTLKVSFSVATCPHVEQE